MSLDNLNLDEIKRRVAAACRAELPTLDQMRQIAREIGKSVKRLNPHSASAVAFVAADGGDNRLRIDAGAGFAPALVELVRIVDSNGSECALEILAESADWKNPALRAESPPLKKMCAALNCAVGDLSRYFDSPASDAVRAYREIVEWSVVFDLLTAEDWRAHTVLVRDGLLRSRHFHPHIFRALDKKIREAHERHKRERNIAVSLIGVAKSSILLDRLVAALAIEAIFEKPYPLYAPIDKAVLEKFYDHRWLATLETAPPDGEYQSMGEMYLVKFGNDRRDPVWTVDIAAWEKDRAESVLGRLMHDALGGFPIPDYPLCLQTAHEYARIGGLELKILQDMLTDTICEKLNAGEREKVLRLKYLRENFAARRYRNA